MGEYQSRHPPASMVQWEAPGAAHNRQELDTFFKNIRIAKHRAAWPPEKQTEFLIEHDLLVKTEQKRLETAVS
jgi:hypothetical protein